MDHTSTHHKSSQWNESITKSNEEILSQSLIKGLINRFNQEGVLYCHWKSKSLQGELDFDLLVSNQSFADAINILMQLGFKPAAPRWGTNPPGVIHYYGYDPNQDDHVHLHIFTRVLSGERFLKSHLFPFEDMMFKNTYSLDGLTVISKEVALVLFVLKTFIRYSSILDVAGLLKSDKKLLEEADRLKEGSDMRQVVILLDKYCPAISEETFLACLNAILTGASFPKKWSLSLQVRRSLRGYRKYSFPDWFLGHAQFLTGTLVKRIRKQKGSKMLLSGGAIIAIVGADATGKSTLVSETSHWLRRNFVVNTVHAGKPPSTLLTYPINFLLVLHRKIRSKLRPVKNAEKDSTSNAILPQAETKSVNSLMYALRAVCLAWDRRALLWKTRRASANGEIIVCDRYPTNATGMMDSPRLLEDSTQKGIATSIYNWLARTERNLYRQIPPPDIVLRLSVSLEVAKKRNAAREIVDDEIYLQNRHQQAIEWFMPGTRSIQDIDTDYPLNETLIAVKQAIWASL